MARLDLAAIRQRRPVLRPAANTLLNPLEDDLTELVDWVEGVSTAAHQAHDRTHHASHSVAELRFEVYEGYLAELHHQQSQAVDDQEAKHW
jgi:hypothetical protein